MLLYSVRGTPSMFIILSLVILIVRNYSQRRHILSSYLFISSTQTGSYLLLPQWQSVHLDPVNEVGSIWPVGEGSLRKGKDSWHSTPPGSAPSIESQLEEIKSLTPNLIFNWNQKNTYDKRERSSGRRTTKQSGWRRHEVLFETVVNQRLPRGLGINPRESSMRPFRRYLWKYLLTIVVTRTGYRPWHRIR